MGSEAKAAELRSYPTENRYEYRVEPPGQGRNCKYIAAHMAYAGVKQDLFTSGAEDEIFKVSAGIPRMINRICEKTLMYAYQQQKRLIDEHMVRFVADHEMVGGIE